MTPLERRYRRVLRILPAGYRAEWEEDMVDTFLLTREPDDPDDADFDAEYGRPSWTEVASVVGLAARLSLGGTLAPPRSFARGEVVRRVALAGLLVHAVSAIVGVVSLLVTQTRFPEYRVSDLDTVWALSAVLWIGSYLVLLADSRHLAAWLGAAALVPTLLDTATDVWSGGVSVTTAGYRFLVAALPLLALAAFHRDAPAVRARPWLIALPVGVVAVMAAALVTQTPGAVALDWPGMLCIAAVVASLALLATGRRGPWTGALPVLAVALLGERVLTLVDYSRFSAPDSQTNLLITTGLVQATALVLVTAPLVIRRVMVRDHAR
jgi:hypothetical protein